MSMIREIGDYRISMEPYSKHMEVLKKFQQDHWNEVKMPGAEGLKLDIDYTQYLLLELTGKHLGFLITKKELPIGYLSVMLYEHHQHKDVMFAQNDGLFIAKPYRTFKTARVLKELFLLVEEELKKRNISYFVLTENTEGSNLEFLAKSLGMTKSAITYTKRL